MRTGCLAAVFLALLSLPPGSGAKERSANAMSDPKVVSLMSEIARWPDERFFAVDQVTVNQAEAFLSRAEAIGVWLAAPRRVDTTRQSRLPLLLLSRTHALRTWSVDTDANAVLVASPLEAAPLAPCMAFPSTKRWAPGDWGSLVGPAPDPSTAAVATSQLITLDARSLCRLPWTAGRVALTYLAYDWASNTVVTELQGPKGSATMGVPAASAAAYHERRLAAPGQYPSYHPTPYHPPLAQPGAALRLPTSMATAAGRLPALGSIRLALPPHTLVTPAEPGLPAALLNAQVLIVQRDKPQQGVVDVVVPVFGPAGVRPTAGSVVDAHFMVDLFPLLEPALEAGDYLAYLVVQEFVSAPVPFKMTGP